MPRTPSAPSTPPPRGAARQSSDVTYLEKHAARHGTPVPPAAHVTIVELYEIERLAAIAANLHQIGIHLRKSPESWAFMIANNPAINDAYQEGFTRYQLEALQQIRDSAIIRGESSLLRLIAERLVDRTPDQGPQWSPPKQAPTVIVQPTAIRVDVVSSAREKLDRQRQLQLESREVIDVESSPVESETAP